MIRFFCKIKALLPLNVCKANAKAPCKRDGYSYIKKAEGLFQKRKRPPAFIFLSFAFAVHAPKYNIHQNNNPDYHSPWIPKSRYSSQAIHSLRKAIPRFLSNSSFPTPPITARHNDEHRLFSSWLPISYTAEYRESNMQNMQRAKPQTQALFRMP